MNIAIPPSGLPLARVPLAAASRSLLRWLARRPRYSQTEGYPRASLPEANPLGLPRGTYLVHRLVAVVCLGRRLFRREVVHHANEDKSCFRPANLVLYRSEAWHRVHHRSAGCSRRLPGQRNPWRRCACGCGRSRRAFDREGRPRAWLNRHQSRCRSWPRRAGARRWEIKDDEPEPPGKLMGDR